MRTIILNGRKYKGYKVLVDDDDYEKVLKYRWQLLGVKGGYPYAYAKIDGKKIGMHRFLLQPREGFFVDHINSDTLDNRRNNLRECTNNENACNSRKSQINKSSIYKGVSRMKNRDGWIAYIKDKTKLIYLGYFKNEIDAAKEYNKHAVKLFGEFAYLNNIKEMA